ncbi:MAG: S1 RNA-binding domain-containing protein [Deltaproteobacteria bacterium]|nr:S1 RNA-binding domain-containing protein [Deltaproteobacteria bacterium]
MSSEEQNNAQQMSDFRMPERRRLEVGEVVEGTVVSIGENYVFIDVGGKSEASVDRKEIEEEGELTLVVGDKFAAYVVAVEPEVELSRAMARGHLNKAALEDAHDMGIPVEGKVTGVNKGGLEVEFNGARAFCPISQIELGFCEDPSRYLEETLEFRVIEFKEGGRNIVVSRRALLEEEQKERAEEIKDQLFEGAEFDGRVATLQPYGAFVDIGGIQGMVHISQISHARIEHPNEVLSEGQTVRVQIVKVEPDPKHPERQRIALSMKALLGDPWDEQVSLLREGENVEGKVVRIQPFGAFVELSPGIDGLVHISEMADRRINTPSDVVKVGDTVRATILRVDREAKRISLSLRQASDEAEGGERVEVRVGELVAVLVDQIKPFGLFVTIKNAGRNARGLIPTEETGAGRNANLRRVFPEGKELKAMITEIDGETGKIRLSIKAGAEMAETEDYSSYKNGGAGKGGAGKSASSASMGTLGDLLKKVLDK